MFGRLLQLAWLGIVAATIVAEVIPVRGLPPMAFYIYKSAKIVMFLLLGYCTPLTFHRFAKLTWGLLMAGGSAVLVEGLQGLIGNGHQFSFSELIAKVILIVLGFALAIEARYERAIVTGKWRIRLISSRIPNR